MIHLSPLFLSFHLLLLTKDQKISWTIELLWNAMETFNNKLFNIIKSKHLNTEIWMEFICAWIIAPSIIFKCCCCYDLCKFACNFFTIERKSFLKVVFIYHTDNSCNWKNNQVHLTFPYKISYRWMDFWVGCKIILCNKLLYVKLDTSKKMHFKYVFNFNIIVVVEELVYRYLHLSRSKFWST